MTTRLTFIDAMKIVADLASEHVMEADDYEDEMETQMAAIGIVLNHIKRLEELTGYTTSVN